MNIWFQSCFETIKILNSFFQYRTDAILIVVRLVTIECIPYQKRALLLCGKACLPKRAIFCSCICCIVRIWTEITFEESLPNKRWLICMTTKLHTGKVCLPSRPQAIAFLERRKLTGLFFRLLLYVVQIYISHLLLLRRPTDLKKFVATKMQFFWERKKEESLWSLWSIPLDIHREETTEKS